MTAGEEPIRILIADDNAEFREGLRGLLAAQPNLVIVGEAATGAAALTLAARTLPDVVLMDLQMPDLNGIEATRRLTAASPHVGVLVVTMFEDDDSVFAAMRAGARGYLLKGARKTETLRAIRAVAAGEAIFSPAIARRLMGFFAARPTPAPFPELTEREREVLALIAQGRDNQAIAAALYLSLKTVRNHVSNIFAKLQVADRAQAAVRAREAGLGREGPGG
ncbi:MAG TPA: response regulator transcription factor [Thermomicrobiales bacterium]|nr:response regulator transcription factor [Thermomicrobiales bacterium]